MARLRTMQIIAGALIAGVVIFLGIALFLVVGSILFATRSEAELRDWLDAIDLAGFLFRAQGVPVILREDGPRLVE